MSNRFAIAVAGLPVALATYLATTPPDVKTIQWDVDSFVHFAPFRTAAYPMLLRLLDHTLGGVGWVVPVQVWTFALAAAFLILAVWSATRSRVATLATAACVSANPIVALFHLKVLSDSLAYSLALGVVGFAFLALRTRSLWPIVGMGLLSGAAIAIRPASLSLALACGAFLWMTWPVGRRAAAARIAALAIPLAACAWAESVAYHAVHPERESVAHRHLFAKAMLAPEPPVLDGTLGRIARDAHAAWAPIRASIDGMPSYGTEMYMTARWEVHGQWTFIDGFDYDAYGAPEGKVEGMRKIALASIRQYPGHHLFHALETWFALWYVPDCLTLPGGEAIRFLMGDRASVNGLSVAEIAPNRPPMEWANLFRGVFLLGMIGPLLLLGFSLRKGIAHPQDPYLVVGATLAVYVIGQTVFVAVTAVAISRYSMALFPFAEMVGVLVAVSALKGRETLFGRFSLRCFPSLERFVPAGLPMPMPA